MNKAVINDAVRVAIDLGGTGSRVLVRGPSQQYAFDDSGWDPALGALGHLAKLTGMVARDDRNRDLRLVVAAGLTGLNGVVPPIDSLGTEFRSRFRVDKLVIADDSLTSALGATGGTPGVTLAIGTGAVALGLGPAGEVARVDGAGGFLGDRGSGWWIGQEALIASFAFLEGRKGGSSALLELANRRYGRLQDLPSALRTAANPFSDVALFASDVAQAARNGDVVAATIFKRAAVHLSTAAAAAALRTNQSRPVPIFLTGGVADAQELLMPTLFETLASLGVEGRNQTPSGDALKGASILLDEHANLSTDLLAMWAHAPRHGEC